MTTTDLPISGDIPKDARGYAFVVLAASLWATLGVMFKALDSLGVQPLTMATARAGLGGLLLLVGLLILRPSALKIERQALKAVVLYGVIGIALFYVAYINAVLNAGVAVAAVLLYTAPAWVALIAWRFLGEHLSRSHIIALLLALIGAALVAEIYRPDLLRLNVWGIVWGLAAGLTYGLWSVFNKVGVRYTNPWALQCYGMLVGALALMIFQPWEQAPLVIHSPAATVWLLLLALGPTIGASVAYATAVQRIPVSVASVVATLEPVIAVMLASLVLGETLAWGQIVGGAMIVTAALLLRPRVRTSAVAH